MSKYDDPQWSPENLMGRLFNTCVKLELVVLIKGLESLDKSTLTEEEKEYADMCLGTLKYQLEGRYTRFDK